MPEKKICHTEHYPSKEKMLRGEIWHPFLEMSAKVKNVLRLSNFYRDGGTGYIDQWQIKTLFVFEQGADFAHPITTVTPNFLTFSHS